jgi:[acyl-carrier-protein] S-malonyltransferase
VIDLGVDVESTNVGQTTKALLLPGYGAQFVGMGKDLYDNSRVMQEYFEEASTVLNQNLVKLCFASSDAEISRIDNALLATFLLSTSIYAHVKDQEGFIPDVITGYTSGQYAALCISGATTFPDMLYLIQKYVAYYQELLLQVPMRHIKVIGADRLTVESVCFPYAEQETRAFISLYESETEHTIVGHQQAVAEIKEALGQDAKKIVELDAVDGLHCPLMELVETHVRTYSAKVDFASPVCPYIAGTTGDLLQENGALKEELLGQIVRPLHWDVVVERLSGYDVLIEIGPGTQLSDKLKKIYSEKTIIAINSEPDISALETVLAGE